MYTHNMHTRSSLSAKRMAQQSPGHNASLHPLISAERIEERRKKGKNREVGGQGAKRRKKKRKGKRRRKWRDREREMPTEWTGACREKKKKTVGKTRKEKETRKMKDRKVDRRGGKKARRIAQQREEKEECMFASHLQWRRTAWQPSDACWMTISSPLSGGWFIFPLLAFLSFLGRKHFTFLVLWCPWNLRCTAFTLPADFTPGNPSFLRRYELLELVCQDNTTSSRSINYYRRINAQSETWINYSQGPHGVIYSHQLTRC